jgi:hypothetical protein
MLIFVKTRILVIMFNLNSLFLGRLHGFYFFFLTALRCKLRTEFCNFSEILNWVSELLEWKSSGSGSRKPILTAVGIRCADQVTGGRLVFGPIRYSNCRKERIKFHNSLLRRTFKI